MDLDLGKLIFPKADPWERRRKMDALILTVVGSLLLIGVVVLLLVSVSGRPRGTRSSLSIPRGANGRL